MPPMRSELKVRHEGWMAEMDSKGKNVPSFFWSDGFGGEDKRNDACRAGNHQSIHCGNGFRIGFEREAAHDVDGQERRCEYGGHEEEAHVVERGVPGEEDECQFVDFPLAALEAIGNHHEADGSESGRTGE